MSAPLLPVLPMSTAHKCNSSNTVSSMRLVSIGRYTSLTQWTLHWDRCTVYSASRNTVSTNCRKKWPQYRLQSVQAVLIAHICHFFYTSTFYGIKIYAKKCKNLWQKLRRAKQRKLHSAVKVCHSLWWYRLHIAPPPHSPQKRDQIPLLWGVNIIATLLSIINVTKYLLIYILQNILLLSCYLFPNSNSNFGLLLGKVFQPVSMNNVYRQKCLSHQIWL